MRKRKRRWHIPLRADMVLPPLFTTHWALRAPGELGPALLVSVSPLWSLNQHIQQPGEPRGSRGSTASGAGLGLWALLAQGPAGTALGLSSVLRKQGRLGYLPVGLV